MSRKIRLAAGVTDCKLGQPEGNAQAIQNILEDLEGEGVDLALFPELSLTGASLGSLYKQDLLLSKAQESLVQLVDWSSDRDLAFCLGLPVRLGDPIYDCLAWIQDGRVEGLVVRQVFDPSQPSYAFQTQVPHFSRNDLGSLSSSLYIGREGEGFPTEGGSRRIGKIVPGPASFLFKVGGDPVRVLLAHSSDLVSSLTGQEEAREADILLVAGSECLRAGSREVLERDLLALSQPGYGLVYASQGRGESTTDQVFSGSRYILGPGQVLKKNQVFDRSGYILADLDLDQIREKKQELGPAQPLPRSFPTSWDRRPATDPYPFIPKTDQGLEEVLTIQALGLARRLVHIGTEDVWLGLSGGLDSTLALLVVLRAFKSAGFDRQGIHTVSMPAYGTSDHTRSNAQALAQSFDLDFREIRLEEALVPHFKDIGLEKGDRSVAFENAQARERTQVLMDLANKEGGIVVGTGDLSEIALGWCTYNGDQMSMYNVNASIPKTLVKALTAYESRRLGKEDPVVGELLGDILATPISPELLPPKEGEGIQNTEKLLGSYDLHDFFLYHFIHEGWSPSRTVQEAGEAFSGRFSRKKILNQVRTFYRRFFNSQFKRSASPDGVEAVLSLSPRSRWQMPSDIKPDLYLKEVDRLLAEGKGEDGGQKRNEG